MHVSKTTCACGPGCSCGCGYGFGYRPGYHLLRWALGLFILFFVFAVGVKVGEFLTALRYGGFNEYGREYPGMMQNQSGYYPGYGASIPPATNVTPTSSPSAGVQVNP